MQLQGGDQSHRIESSETILAAQTDTYSMPSHVPTTRAEFPGFPDLRANVTFVPLQFFTVVLPHRSRGCVRLVGFMLRRLLGWVDADGNPTREQLQFSYRELMEGAGISRDMIAGAMREALAYHLIVCLREPCADQSGQGGKSGIYALRWSERYTDSPEEFTGFFQREAVALPGEAGTQVGPVAKAARKNIPNAFFDYVLRKERLSVVQVVGVMLFKSIQWGPGGERKVPVNISITELCRLTRLTRRHVHEALQDALRCGYVERVKEGRFDPKAGAESHAATYRIRWTSQFVNPVHVLPANYEPHAHCGAAAPYSISDRSEIGYRRSARKRNTDQPEKENGDRPEKGNGISIKRSFKNPTTAAVGEASVAVAAGGVVEKLLEAGFDAPTAAHLAKTHAPEIIRRQLDWLSLRQASRNRLGFLRRAIEQDWPKPEAGTAAGEFPLGAIFARHYEAAFHRLIEPPASCSSKEAAHAGEFLRRLELNATETQAAEWGRSFGAFARAKAPSKPWLVWVLRMHGDEFVRQQRQVATRARRVSTTEARHAREESLQPAYQAYLRETEARCKSEQPKLYAMFEAHCQDVIERLGLSEKSRALLAGETSRLSMFADFMREQKQPVFLFKEWDSRLNVTPTVT